MTMPVRTCPLCGQQIDGIDWLANIQRSRYDAKGRRIPSGLPDYQFSVPPGTFTAQPCGHRLEPTLAGELWQEIIDNQNPKP
jgi:hypothetical protein